jgi:hypothetical protein
MTKVMVIRMEKKIFLHGEGAVDGVKLENDEAPGLQSDAISYGAGSENPMEGLAEDLLAYDEALLADADLAEEMNSQYENILECEQANENLERDSGPPLEESIESKIVINRDRLPESKKPGFDNSATQDARKDVAIEGGVTNPRRSTGTMNPDSGSTLEGRLVTNSSVIRAAEEGPYRLSGFYVEAPTKTGVSSVKIDQNFKDVETAKFSINNGVYLMPIESGGFVACPITQGAPIICTKDRQVMEYIDSKWRRS